MLQGNPKAEKISNKLIPGKIGHWQPKWSVAHNETTLSPWEADCGEASAVCYNWYSAMTVINNTEKNKEVR